MDLFTSFITTTENVGIDPAAVINNAKAVTNSANVATNSKFVLGPKLAAPGNVSASAAVKTTKMARLGNLIMLMLKAEALKQGLSGLGSIRQLSDDEYINNAYRNSLKSREESYINGVVLDMISATGDMPIDTRTNKWLSDGGSSYIQPDLSGDKFNTSTQGALRWLVNRSGVAPENIYRFKEDAEHFDDLNSIVKNTYSIPDWKIKEVADRYNIKLGGRDVKEGNSAVQEIRYAYFGNKTPSGNMKLDPIMFIVTPTKKSGTLSSGWFRPGLKKDGSRGWIKVNPGDLQHLHSSAVEGTFNGDRQPILINKANEPTSSENFDILNDISAGDIGSVADDINEAASSFRNYEKEINDRDAFINHLMMNEISPRIRGTYKKGE